MTTTTATQTPTLRDLYQAIEQYNQAYENSHRGGIRYWGRKVDAISRELGN